MAGKTPGRRHAERAPYPRLFAREAVGRRHGYQRPEWPGPARSSAIGEEWVKRLFDRPPPHGVTPLPAARYRRRQCGGRDSVSREAIATFSRRKGTRFAFATFVGRGDVEAIHGAQTMTNVKSVLAAAAIVSAAMIAPAAAAPAANLATTAQTRAVVQPGVQDVRWVCGPYRCWWRPGPVWWGPRPWGWRGGWGWRRGWGWRGGWRRW
jgi:hypothetical protein